MRMDPELVGLVFHRATKDDWASSCCLNAFFSYDFVTSIVQGYPSGRSAMVKRQRVDDGPKVTELAPSVDIIWLLSLACGTVSKDERN